MIRAACRVISVALAMALAACQPESRLAEYRPAMGAPWSVDYDVALAGKAEGFRGARPYDARVRARLDLKAVRDSAAGRIDLAISADSVDFSADDRDDPEGEYMEERLRRYKSRLVLDATGRILSVEEEPDMPPVDFSPLNFGRFLAYAVPAFPKEPVKPGSEWQVDQPLLDKFHPASRVVKRYRAQGIRESPEGSLLECAVEVQAWLEDGLSSREAASGGAPRPDLAGRGEAVFNLDRGLPVSSELELEGRFQSQFREGPADSSRFVDLPLLLGLKVVLRFRGG